MPIQPRHRRLHPFDWPQLSASVRSRRADGRCGRCAEPHGREVLRLGDGLWRDEGARASRCRRLPPPHGVVLPMRHTRLSLSACHLDHDPTNDEGSDLAALCQRCHHLRDAPEHRRRQAVTVRAQRADRDLFME